MWTTALPGRAGRKGREGLPSLERSVQLSARRFAGYALARKPNLLGPLVPPRTHRRASRCGLFEPSQRWLRPPGAPLAKHLFLLDACTSGDRSRSFSLSHYLRRLTLALTGGRERRAQCARAAGVTGQTVRSSALLDGISCATSLAVMKIVRLHEAKKKAYRPHERSDDNKQFPVWRGKVWHRHASRCYDHREDSIRRNRQAVP